MNYDDCDHNFCDDCCHHGDCVDCGMTNPDFEGCALDLAKAEEAATKALIDKLTK